MLRVLAVTAVLAATAAPGAAAATTDVPGAGWRPGGGYVTATYDEAVRWRGGAVGWFDVDNPSGAGVRGWSVEFTLPRRSKVVAWWNAFLVPVGRDRYRFHSTLWNMSLPPGGDAAFGFVILGSGQPSDVVVRPSGPGPTSTTTTTTPTTTTSTTTTSTTTTSTSTTTLPTTTTTVPGGTLTPRLDCISSSPAGYFVAHFGWGNDGDEEVSVPIGPANGFDPQPVDRGQPTTFEPGRTPAWPQSPLSIPFDGNPLTWTLDGGTATATRASVPCYVDVEIDVSWVGADGRPIEPPAGVGTVELAARSDLGSAECSGNGAITCTYDNEAPAKADGLAVPVTSVYEVFAEELPADVSVASGDGGTEVPTPDGTCGTTTRRCTHEVVLQYGGAPTTTTSSSTTTSSTTSSTTSTTSTTSSTTTSTTSSTTTTTVPTTTSTTSTTSTTVPTTTTAPTTSTTAPTTTAAPTTSVAPTSSAPPTTALPTTTAASSTTTSSTGPSSTPSSSAPSPSVAGDVVVSNRTSEARTFVVVCDELEVAPGRVRLTVAPGEELTVARVAHGTYCTAFVESSTDGDSIVTPTGAGVVGWETDTHWSFAGARRCTDELVFTAHPSAGEPGAAPRPGVRPPEDCEQAAESVAPPSPEDGGDDLWLVLAGLGALAAVIAVAVAAARRQRREEP